MQQQTAEGSSHLLALPPGTLVGGYEVLGVLGRPGGFGITYLAGDRVLETHVAIKEFLPRDLAGRAPGSTAVTPHSTAEVEPFRHGLKGFLEEARILARIEHPNIVRVRGFFEANATAYLVMEYVDGRTLAERLQHEPASRLPPDGAVAIVLAVLDGLAAVHRQGILHRDVSPENVYLALDGHPILLDFGAARKAVEEHSRSMTAIFRPGYAPMEQYVRRGQQGPWTDVYACAAVLYRALTGEAPPEAPERMADDPLVPPARRVPGLDPALSDAIVRALAMDPRKRPQTVEAFAASLRPPAAVRVPHVFAATGGEAATRGALDGRGGGGAAPRADPGPRARGGPGAKAAALAAAATVVLSVAVGARLRGGGEGAAVPASAQLQPQARPAAPATAGPDAPGVAPPSQAPAAPEPPAVQGPTAVRLALEEPRPLKVGDVVRLTAQAFDENGAPLPAVAVRWRSSDPEVVGAGAETGVLSARAPGAATVIARAGELRASVRVEVSAPAVAAVRVDAPQPLRVGERVRLYPRLADERGRDVPGRVSWNVSDEHVARVDPDGTVRAVGPGTALVTATAGAAATRVEVTVLSSVARSAPPTAYSPPAYTAPPPPPSPSRAENTTVIRDGANACHSVVLNRNMTVLSGFYGAQSAHDQYTLGKLRELASSEERRLRVNTLTAPGQPQVEGNFAYVDFAVRLQWKNSFGGNRSANVTFRGTFQRGAGGWQMTSCRIVGSPDLD